MRRLAVIRTCSFAVVFALWGATSLDWTNLAVSTSSASAETPASTESSQAQIDIPQFAHPLSAGTDFAFITSRTGRIAGLTYKVGGEPISGKPFIFAHADSRLEYDLTQKGWSMFEFSTGIDDAGGADRGTVVYVVRGDGKELFRSPVVRALQPPHPYGVNVVNIQRLELSVTDAGDSITADEAYWIQPVLR